MKNKEKIIVDAGCGEITLIQSLIELFSDSFKLEESLEYNYKMPWGDFRKYITCIFSKISEN